MTGIIHGNIDKLSLRDFLIFIFVSLIIDTHGASIIRLISRSADFVSFRNEDNQGGDQSGEYVCNNDGRVQGVQLWGGEAIELEEEP